MKLAEALENRASFRRFCGFSATERTPERSAFVRFRAELLRRNLDRVLFAPNTQSTLVEATLIASASIRYNDQARRAGHPVAGRQTATRRSGSRLGQTDFVAQIIVSRRLNRTGISL
jgi:IS5 family transposase